MFPESGRKTAITVPLDFATAADQTIRSIDAGVRFVVEYIFIQGEGTTDLTFKSGSTALSGDIAVTSSTEIAWGGNGVPVFLGRDTGDDFVITNSAAVQVNGWAVITEIR